MAEKLRIRRYSCAGRQKCGSDVEIYAEKSKKKKKKGLQYGVFWKSSFYEKVFDLFRFNFSNFSVLQNINEFKFA